MAAKQIDVTVRIGYEATVHAPGDQIVLSSAKVLGSPGPRKSLNQRRNTASPAASMEGGPRREVSPEARRGTIGPPGRGAVGAAICSSLCAGPPAGVPASIRAGGAAVCQITSVVYAADLRCAPAHVVRP
jgi:hypothetical protein